jgi:1-acyl-sn-glycerol-3-phosphate acyltransferase
MFAALYIALDSWLLVAGFWLWLRNPRQQHVDPDRWTTAHCHLLRVALSALRRSAERNFGYSVEFADDLPEPERDRPLIVLARHAGPGDSFTLVEMLLRRLDRRPRVVLKAALRWDPGLDVILTRLSGCFIPSRTGAGDDTTAKLAAQAASLRGRDALLLFPEGGNWTPRRHRRAVIGLLRRGRRAAARRARTRPRVLPLRPEGTLACLAARPDADVLVVAHAGLDMLTSVGAVWRALPLRDRPMRIRWWLYPAASVPRDEESARHWLEQRWSQVHAWIDAQPAPGAPATHVPS